MNDGYSETLETSTTLYASAIGSVIDFGLGDDDTICSASTAPIRKAFDAMIEWHLPHFEIKTVQDITSLNGVNLYVCTIDKQSTSH